jgi:hypothetical protein
MGHFADCRTRQTRALAAARGCPRGDASGTLLTWVGATDRALAGLLATCALSTRTRAEPIGLPLKSRMRTLTGVTVRACRS